MANTDAGIVEQRAGVLAQHLAELHEDLASLLMLGHGAVHARKVGLDAHDLIALWAVGRGKVGSSAGQSVNRLEVHAALHKANTHLVLDNGVHLGVANRLLHRSVEQFLCSLPVLVGVDAVNLTVKIFDIHVSLQS